MSGNKTRDVLENLLVSGANTSKVSKWYVDTMLSTDLRKVMEMVGDANRDAAEFEDVMTRVSEVFDKDKLKKAYNVIGLILSLDGKSDDDVEDSLVVRGNTAYAKTDRVTRDVTLAGMRDSVANLLKNTGIGSVSDTANKDVLNVSSGKDRSDERVEGDDLCDESVNSIDVLSDKERLWMSEGYVRTIEKDDLGIEHAMYSKSFERFVTGYMGMKEVCDVLGKSEPYIKRIARMIGAVTIRNRFYADEKLIERVRSELVAIKKIGNGYMSMTDFAIAANMTRRGATRVVRAKLDYKERNMNLFVKRSAANKFIRENVESVPNPFEYVTVREIEYATGILITSEYSDSDSLLSGLALKYRNNRMILISEMLRMLEVKGKLDTFNVKVRNELLLEYMRGYLELSNEDVKRDFRKNAGVYGRYLSNMDDLENPKQWLKDMLANDAYMMFSKVKEDTGTAKDVVGSSI